jgi:hypothetical protein
MIVTSIKWIVNAMLGFSTASKVNILYPMLKATTPRWNESECRLRSVSMNDYFIILQRFLTKHE